MGIAGNASHIMVYPGNLAESIREIGDVLTTSYDIPGKHDKLEVECFIKAKRM